MTVATKQVQTTQKRALRRRLWKAPTSAGRWYWLAASVLLYGGILAWFYYAGRTQDPDPATDPFRLFGIIAYILVLGTAVYSLRRRFVRGLPGKVQSWLWMHTWMGIITILIAMLHENYAFVLHDFVQRFSDLTDTYWAGGALFSLIALVAVGIIGRFLDMWQTRVIARDASANGAGIVQTLEERLLEQEYTVERLCAGKSEVFKEYCLQALKHRGKLVAPGMAVAAIPPQERAEFQRAYETLAGHVHMVRSLRLQKRARWTMRCWRYVHTTIACIALIVISYHAIMETLTNVLHVIKAA